MDIQVSNLNEGYNQCEGLNSLVSSTGESLISNLETNINNLKVHWIGSDATVHINNLIQVHDALVALISDAKSTTSDAGNKIIAIQEVRSANGGGGSIGSPLSSAAPNSSSIAQCESTEEYYVDPSASSDYTMLQEECTSFTTFISDFKAKKEALLQNWTAGANREQAVANFNEFEGNAETYNKYLTEARDNLGIAVSNLNQL